MFLEDNKHIRCIDCRLPVGIAALQGRESDFGNQARHGKGHLISIRQPDPILRVRGHKVLNDVTDRQAGRGRGGQRGAHNGIQYTRIGERDGLRRRGYRQRGGVGGGVEGVTDRSGHRIRAGVGGRPAQSTVGDDGGESGGHGGNGDRAGLAVIHLIGV